jgi:hypothetical protein
MPWSIARVVAARRAKAHLAGRQSFLGRAFAWLDKHTPQALCAGGGLGCWAVVVVAGDDYGLAGAALVAVRLLQLAVIGGSVWLTWLLVESCDYAKRGPR